MSLTVGTVKAEQLDFQKLFDLLVDKSTQLAVKTNGLAYTETPASQRRMVLAVVKLLTFCPVKYGTFLQLRVVGAVVVEERG